MNPFDLDLAAGLLCLALSGCGASPSLPSIPTTSTVPVPAGQTSAPAPTVDNTGGDVQNDGGGNLGNSGTPVSLTLFTYTKVIATTYANNSTTTLQATAYCLNYQSKDYCWDNGLRVNQFVSMTYWGIDESPAACPNFFGYCHSDLLSSPTYMDSAIINILAQASGSAHRTVSEVYANGASQLYQCTDNSGKIDCSDFLLDTTRLPQ